uniref:Rho GTPase-activating protein 15 n=1 Tax=Denticeps clupeoides TaxID=299321 RepID=A0AAY4ATA4_9TELE
MQNATKSTQGVVQMRIKSSSSSGERLSQTRSMVISDTDVPISRHRRNQSQHSIIGPSESDVTVSRTSYKLTQSNNISFYFRKNWTSTWVVLSNNKLLFYKESKQEVTNLKPGNKPDEVDLCGATVEWTSDKSSRKNVFQIMTTTGHEFLLQSDNYPSICKWHDTIKMTADRLSSAGRQSLQRSSSTDLLSRRPSDLPAAKEAKPENRRSLIFKLNYSASDSADKNGVKSRLKKFISRRPSMKTLQEKGIIKDRVFGCHLVTLCNREGSTVPKFVKQCFEEVEKRGLEADGIYRVSGNLATIQKLRFLVDQEEELNLEQSQWEDIHVITGAVKMFFRELPEPLFPFRFFEPFVEAIKSKDAKQKVQAVKKLIHQLPKPNHDTIKLLFRHLQKVLAHSRKNLMSTQGISIVFGPTLMWPEMDSGNMAVNMMYQNQIMEVILIDCLEIFGGN